jgi:hypothetical protein
MSGDEKTSPDGPSGGAEDPVTDSPSRGTGTIDEQHGTVEIRHLPPDPTGERATGYSAQAPGEGESADGIPTVVPDGPSSAPGRDLGPPAPGPDR